MKYELTAEDIQLLLDCAGAMGAGLALQPTKAARFGNIGIPAAPDSSATHNPSFKWDHAEGLRQLALRAQGGSTTPVPPPMVLMEVPPSKFSQSIRFDGAVPGQTVIVPFRRTAHGPGSASVGVDGGVGVGRAQISGEPGWFDQYASGLSGGAANVPIDDVLSLLYFNFRVEEGAPSRFGGVLTISLPQ